MKKILFAIFIITGVFSYTDIKAQWITGSYADTTEIKYMAKMIKDRSVVMGVFLKPDASNTRMRKMKSGIAPENTDGYMDIRKAGIQKMYPQSLPDNDLDSVIFVDNPTMVAAQDEGSAFYSYPGTTWFLILRKCITGKDATKTKGWAKSLQNEELITGTTAYSFVSTLKGNYVMEWNNKYEKPTNTLMMNRNVANELVLLSRYVKSLPENTSNKDFKEKVKAYESNLKTNEAKAVLREVLKD